jgi:hypothetical protein
LGSATKRTRTGAAGRPLGGNFLASGRTVAALREANAKQAQRDSQAKPGEKVGAKVTRDGHVTLDKPPRQQRETAARVAKELGCGKPAPRHERFEN